MIISSIIEKLQSFKWENAMTIDSKSWGFRANAPLSDYMTIKELIETLMETVRYLFLQERVISILCA